MENLWYNIENGWPLLTEGVKSFSAI